MSTTTIEIVLELDANDCPTGTAAAAGQEPRRFHGWLGLVTAIGALTRSNGGATGEGSTARTSPIQGEPQ
jgi:hypothetical protein